MGEEQTIIGAGSTVRGTVEGNEDLTVCGRLEGSLSLSGKLTVQAGASVQADVSVDSAWIGGVLVGNVDAADKVHITAGGRVVGDIRAVQVVLEEGAAYNGNIDMGEFELTTEAPKKRAELTPSPKPSVPAARSVPVARRVPAPVSVDPEPLSAVSLAEAEPPRPAPRSSGGFSRPPMPVPSRPAAAPFQERPQERRGAPAPRVRPVGRVKVKKPAL